MPLRIANAAGFWGDDLSAARRLLATEQIDYLTLEYLAELTMSILARQRQKNPLAGYATDVCTVLSDILPQLQQQSQLRLVTNAGGVNPRACVQAISQLLVQNQLSELPVACVAGDDLLPRLPELQRQGLRFENLDTGQPLHELSAPIIAANAYLGAQGIVEALSAAARIVITGRVADASLCVGPAQHHYGWNNTDYHQLAGASVAGHLIECGAQVTGGLTDRWSQLDLTDVGYPIAEIDADGSCTITKPRSSGGEVTTATVKQQLVYEIGDPTAYHTPDVTVDFTTLAVTSESTDRVRVTQATGRQPPASYKVSLCYAAGYVASGQLLIAGRDCQKKAGYCAELMRRRLQRNGLLPNRWQVELLGANHGVPGLLPAPTDAYEVILRITGQDLDRQRVEALTREFAPLITNGPAGIAGYAAGRAEVRPQFAYWPTTIPRELVTPTVTVLPAATWLHEVVR
jgi:hypothetical protein